MFPAKPSRQLARIITVLLSTSLLSFAAPAVSQAHVHHHAAPAVGHGDPYTRVVSAAKSGL